MKTAAECTRMAEIRAELDRVDEDLVRLFAERATYIDRAAVVKTGINMPAWITSRVEEVLWPVGRPRDGGQEAEGPGEGSPAAGRCAA